MTYYLPQMGKAGSLFWSHLSPDNFQTLFNIIVPWGISFCFPFAITKFIYYSYTYVTGTAVGRSIRESRRSF